VRAEHTYLELTTIAIAKKGIFSHCIRDSLIPRFVIIIIILRESTTFEKPTQCDAACPKNHSHTSLSVQQLSSSARLKIAFAVDAHLTHKRKTTHTFLLAPLKKCNHPSPNKLQFSPVF
jgi:hypothetical protein